MTKWLIYGISTFGFLTLGFFLGSIIFFIAG